MRKFLRMYRKYSPKFKRLVISAWISGIIATNISLPGFTSG